MGSYKKIRLSHEIGLIDTPPLAIFYFFFFFFFFCFEIEAIYRKSTKSHNLKFKSGRFLRNLVSQRKLSFSLCL